MKPTDNEPHRVGTLMDAAEAVAGANARRAGADITTNPHERMSEPYFIWRAGWHRPGMYTPEPEETSKTEHVWYTCPDPCPKHTDEFPRPCHYCDGGLAFCTVCKKGEGELEETCPGPPAEGEG